jgi:hypothetical protein
LRFVVCTAPIGATGIDLMPFPTVIRARRGLPHGTTIARPPNAAGSRAPNSAPTCSLPTAGAPSLRQIRDASGGAGDALAMCRQQRPDTGGTNGRPCNIKTPGHILDSLRDTSRRPEQRRPASQEPALDAPTDDSARGTPMRWAKP